MRFPKTISILVILLMTVTGCAHAPRRFPLAEPLWEDPDRNHVPEKPDEYTSGLYADAVDQVALRPLSALFAFQAPGEAVNVNSIDEVPDCSWFENRLGLFPLTPREAARGSCEGPPLDPGEGPWVVTRAKLEGVTPGFFIKAPDGHSYLLKFDGPWRPQRGTAADVIGSKLYHAVGYPVPCNEIVYFRSSVIEKAPDAVTKDDLGRKRPLTQSEVDDVLAGAFRLKNGMIRASASRFLPGEPLGPYPIEGVRTDDPNDVVPHEDRRELRALRLMSAWLNHFDIREQNSLDMWVEEEGRTFVRHFQIDFGDSFGTPWVDDRLNRRVGHSYYFDWGHLLVDLISLGLISRPWHHARINDGAEIFGYFGWEKFTPSAWKPIYPNPIFSRMTYRDALWIVRKIVHLSDEHLAAIVKKGRLSNPRHERYLLRALIERRDRIAGEYLSGYIPLDGFRLVRREPGNPAQSLCFEDLAIRHAGASPQTVLYKVGMLAGEDLDQRLGWLQFQPDPDHPDRSCVLLPLGDRRPADLAPEGAADDHASRYTTVVIDVYPQPSESPRSIVVHLVDLGHDKGFVLVGLERPPNPH